MSANKFIKKPDADIKIVSAFFRKHILFSAVIVLGIVWITIAKLVFHFESMSPNANIQTYSDALWWGIVTFLTVGYGDKYPVTIEGRILAGFLMVTGVVVMGILTAKISAYFLERALLERNREVKTDSLMNHFIICGFKANLHEVLLHILNLTPELKSKDIVLVSEVHESELESIRAHEDLKDIQWVKGSYYEEIHLRRAAPERARKVLLLADQLPGPNGQIPSATEVDARTIMTAMTLANIAPKTLVAAELLDSKMEQYLRLAHVNEIIFSREYSRLLLGNAATGTGVANIIFDLLSPETPTVITTRSIDEHWVGRMFSELKADYESKIQGLTIIGILENTGNSFRIKDTALRQAQKTPDVSKLVQNLKNVKTIKCNHPLFNPGPDYIIPDGSLAIVIENRAQSERNSKHVTSEETKRAA